MVKKCKHIRQSANLLTLLTGDNLNGKALKGGENGLWQQCLNIPQGYGAFVVVKDGKAVIMAKGRSYHELKFKLIREEYLNGRNATND